MMKYITYIFLFLLSFISCKNRIPDKNLEIISNPFITNYTTDNKGNLFIIIDNPSEDNYSISSLEYLCNVDVRAKNNYRYIEIKKVNVNCSDKIMSQISLKSGDSKKFKFSLNENFSFYNGEKIEIYYIGKIFKNGKEVKLSNNRLL